MSKKRNPLLEAARTANTNEKRLMLDKPVYKELREVWLEFAQDRLAGNHACGVVWFRKTGLPIINAERAKRKQKPLAIPMSDNTLLTWLERHHPKIRELFRR